jgi:DNA polymerase I-like protein with 3'-5' exonuclease and polymerase domains
MVKGPPKHPANSLPINDDEDEPAWDPSDHCDVSAPFLIEAAKKEGLFVYDLETTGLNPRKDRIEGVAFYVPNDNAPEKPPLRAWFPFVEGTMDYAVGGEIKSARAPLDQATTINALREIWSIPELVAVRHNGGFDDAFLYSANGTDVPIIVKNKIADSMLADYVADERHRRYGLKPRVWEVFQHRMTTYEEAAGRQGVFSFARKRPLGAYAADDCTWTYRLFKWAMESIRKQDPAPEGREMGNLERIFWNIEMKVQRVLMEMEMQGCLIDWEWLVSVEQRLEREKLEILEKIQALAGWAPNLRSPKQVSGFLYNSKEEGGLGLPTDGLDDTWNDDLETYSTADKAIQQFGKREPVVEHLLRFRSLEVISRSFCQKLIHLAQEEERVHARFGQTRTVIGRLSCIAKGTPIEVVRDVSKSPDGIPIEDVRPGDLAYTYDDNLRLTLRRVKNSWKSGHGKVVRVRWQATSNKRSGYIDVTPEHRLRRVDGSYVEASKLVPGDRLLSLSRSTSKPYSIIYPTGDIAIRDHRWIYETINGQVGDLHVHHKDGNKLNNRLDNLEALPGSDHVRYYAKEMWKDPEIRSTIAEDHFESKPTYNHVVVAVEPLPNTIDVYDMEVEDTHNFIAGEIDVCNSSDPINLMNQPREKNLIRRAFCSRRPNDTDRRRSKLLFGDADYCLVGDTQVETLTGSKPIKDLAIGEKLFCYRASDERSWWCEVEKKVCTGPQTVWRVRLDDGGVIEGSGHHKLWLRDGNKSEIKDLKPGDRLMPFKASFKAGQKVGLNHKVISVVMTSRQELMYDIQVSGDHNFALTCGVISSNSQMELRMAAHLAQEPNMLEVYKNVSGCKNGKEGDGVPGGPCDRYLHFECLADGSKCKTGIPKDVNGVKVCTFCGSSRIKHQERCRHVDLHQRTSEDVGVPRNPIAKSQNFGLLYRMGAPKFAVYADLFDDNGVPRIEYAEELISKWKDAYPGIAVWHKKVIAKLKANKFISYSLTRRRRRLEAEWKREETRYRAETQAIQFEVSGCVIPTTPVLTHSGYIEIAKLAESGAAIFDGVGFTKNYRVFDTGTKEVFKVTLSDGRSLTCSADHRFATMSGLSMEWAKTSDLDVGTMVATRDLLAPGGNLDHGASVDDAYLVGAFASKQKKMIPEWVFTAAPEIRGAVLAGLFDTDGSVLSYKQKARTTLTIQYSSQVKDLAVGARRLASSLGIECGLRELDVMASSKAGGLTKQYRLDVVYRGFREFDRWVQLRHPRKAATLAGALQLIAKRPPRRELPSTYVMAVAELADRTPIPASRQGSSSLFDDAKLRRKVQTYIGHARTGNAGDGMVGAILDYIDERDLKWVSTYGWARVVSVEPIGQSPTYDIEIRGDNHAYIADGLFTHNSCQDLIKLAMIRIFEERNHKIESTGPAEAALWDQFRFMIQVHDELIFEFNEDIKEEVTGMVKRNMEGVASALSVPFLADVRSGTNWDHTH